VINHAVATTKVLGYVRVSTRSQAAEGFSLPVQAARVVAFCVQHGLDLLDVIEDGGRSAESLDRKGIREVFARLDSGEASGVVVAKLDRLTRSVRDWSGLVEDRFGRKGGGQRLYSASDSLDLLTPSGRFVANVLIAFAECELDTGVERSESVMSDKRVKGERIGTIPYGSMLARDGKTLAPCPPEVATLGVMVDIRNRGWKLRRIAEELDRMGLGTRSGRPWAFATVGKLLGDYYEAFAKHPESDPLQGLEVPPGLGQ
jgi:DNA invertase Pin-like site-specific DNA recombinase